MVNATPNKKVARSDAKAVERTVSPLQVLKRPIVNGFRG